MPKFRELSIDERIDFITDFYNLPREKADILRNHNTLDNERLERIGENPVSNSEYPLRFSDTLSINGKAYHIPIETEEASVVAGLSYGGKICGNIEAHVLESYSIGQVQIKNIDICKFENYVKDNKESLIGEINNLHKKAKAFDIKTEKYKLSYGTSVLANVYLDPGDAMGAAVSGKMAEEFANIVSHEFPDIKYKGSVVSNNSGRLTVAKTKIHEEELKRYIFSGKEVKEGIIEFSELAKINIDRNITNDKGVMNGVEGIARVLAQDTRAIYAANKNNPYLSRWYGDEEYLCGELKMMIPCGIIGGEIDNYPKAKVLLEDVIKPKNANELAEIMAAVGLAQNLAALSMNCTIGATKGHEPFR